MELKFGHRVIAYKSFRAGAKKGRYVSYSNDPGTEFPHYVLLDGTLCPTIFRHAELDPDATEFLPGDEVEMRDGNDGEWRLLTYGHPNPISSAHRDSSDNHWQHCRYPRKDALHGKTAIIDGKKYELRLK